MKKTSVFFLLTIFHAISVLAQTVRVQAPSHVSVGENFRLSYVVNTQDVDNFRAGEVPEGLEIITGPYTSRSSSIQMVNGHTTSSSSITYTYTLYAAKNGTYTIPAAKAVINGKTVTSDVAKITVSGTASQNGRQGAPRMHGSGNDDDMRVSGTKITGNDFFIRVSANKQRVHEQEPILLTYKVYTQVELSQLEGKMPDLTGFHTQELQLPQQKSFKVETVDGKQYRTVTWSQYVMYPQMTGKLEIPSITFKGIVVQRNQNVDPFEAFFNGGSAYTEVRRDVKAPAVTIQVDQLPTRPAGFSGGVGNFAVQSAVNKNTVKAGEPITLTFTVSGTGNLKLIKQPVLEFPKDFDKYDPKVTDNTQLTQNGLEGSMTYEYLIVPRNQGKYTLPAISFIYFDLATKTYKTAKTDAVNITVLKGDGKSTTVDFSAQNDNDIRNIKTGNSEVVSNTDFLFGSSTYYLLTLLPLAVFVALVIVFRKRANDHANIVGMRGKKANKVATKRLRTAAKLMAKGQQNAFYDEVLRALWGYVSDKLNIAVEKLSRENISEKLAERNIDQATISTFIEAIDECEYARYAPGDPKGRMDNVYEKAVKAITDIDNMLKANKKNGKSKALLLCLFIMMATTTEAAVTKQSADAEYANGNYQEAIKQYNELLAEGVSEYLYYNLGNAYFRTGNITQAILAYERAHKMAPSNEDIRFNLQFARSKTADKIIPENEVFFVTWYRSFVNSASSNTWAVVSVVAFIIMLCMFLCYLFAPTALVIRGGFYSAIVCGVVFISTMFLAWQQKRMAQNNDSAIIISPVVNIKKTPSNTASNEMVLHEGTKVKITDRTMKGWLGISLSDGREGWLQDSDIEEI